MTQFRAFRSDRRGFVSIEYGALAAISAFCISTGVHEVAARLHVVFQTLEMALSM